MDYNEIVAGFEDARQMSPKGIEYWMGRKLMELLGYTKWSNFLGVMRKAIAACDSDKTDPCNHFAKTGTMVSIGSGATRKMDDFYLSRFACYLIAMNGNSSKQEIAAAQKYFAVQTRISELLVEKRLGLRDRVTQANKQLVGAAKNAGVQRFDLFHHHGYLGLYDCQRICLPSRQLRKSSPSTRSSLLQIRTLP